MKKRNVVKNPSQVTSDRRIFLIFPIVMTILIGFFVIMLRTTSMLIGNPSVIGAIGVWILIRYASTVLIIYLLGFLGFILVEKKWQRYSHLTITCLLVVGSTLLAIIINLSSSSLPFDKVINLFLSN